MDDVYLEMENDELNQHECMLAFSCLLKHMSTQGFMTKQGTVPGWLSTIVENLEGGSISNSVKLFLGRLIINNAQILHPYAQFLLKPLMSMILSGIAGLELNYYSLDIVITMLSWSPDATPKDNCAYEASEVLKFIIINSGHDRRDIFRHNLEVIKTMLECWKDGLTIPYEYVYEKMQSRDPDNKQHMIGIQILGVIISTGFPPYDLKNEIKGQSFLSILLRKLSHKYKEVYASAAEVIGIILKSTAENEHEAGKTEFYDKVVLQLENLSSDPNKGKFIQCLNKIHFYCPQIADKFVPRLLLLQPSIHGVFQNYILEILCSRIGQLESGYQQLKSMGLFDEIELKDKSSQLLLLQALENVFPHLSCDEVLYILPIIIEIRYQPATHCRLVLYRILMFFFDKFRGNNGIKEKEIFRLSQETLLIGLADSDPTLRITVNNFWSNDKRLAVGTKERLLALMTNMYSPLTEESFLQYTTFLLLERTSWSPDYKRKIFEYPLSECTFLSYNIQTSWRRRHAAMSPMFIESASSSFNSSLNAFEGQNASSQSENIGLVRATQKQDQFPETVMSATKSDTYNWLTEKSLDTFAGQDFSTGSFSSEGSISKSHLFALKDNTTTLKINLQAPGSDIRHDQYKKDNKKSSVWMLKRRFLKDKVDSNVFAKRELKRQDLRKEMLKDQQNRRDAQVVMYRKYRIGELPDIEITNAAIIAPIQALAMNDAVIAKMLFRSLLVAVCSTIKDENPDGYQSFCKDIGLCLAEILQSSHMNSPAVISFCLETLNCVDDIKFDAEQIFMASKGSNQESMGILLLEAKILKGFDTEPPRKKIKQIRPPVPENMTHWMKLAELYRLLNDYDMVNAVFSQVMGGREQNRKALQLEISGQYFDAVTLYCELYDNTSEEYEQAEKDFWDTSILSCYDKLTKWGNLETTVLSRFTDSATPNLQKIWDDQYYKDNYLPYLIRSKTKLVIDGKQDQSILTFLDQLREDEEKKTHLEDTFSEELAILYLIQEKFDIARHYSSSCINKFLKDWYSLSSHAVGAQQSKLQNLQKLTELEEFLSLMKPEKMSDHSCIKNVLKTWQKRLPSPVDPVNVWDDINANRNLYIKLLQDKYFSQSVLSENMPEQRTQDSFSDSQIDETESCNIKTLAFETSICFKLYFAENCALQKNFPVAVNILKLIHVNDSKKLGEYQWSKFIEIYCSTNNSRAFTFPSQRKLDMYISSWNQLDKLEQRCGSSVSQKILQSQSLELIAEMFEKDEVLFSEINHAGRDTLFAISGAKSEQQVAAGLLHRSFSCLNQVISTFTCDLDTSAKLLGDEKKVASAHLNLAKFCNKYLRQQEADMKKVKVYQKVPSFAKYPSVLTESLLIALSHGDQEALQLFPRLLQIIESYPLCIPIFIEKVMSIPCWMFIGWINQMVALLDKHEAKAVHNIIHNIVDSYPNAIVYSLHLSYESFKFSDTDEGQRNKIFVEKIKAILEKCTLIYDFMAALEHLSVPHVIYKDCVQNIMRLMKNKSNQHTVILEFRKMFSMLFTVSENEDRRVPQGLLQVKFAECFREKILDIFGEDGSKILASEDVQSTCKALLALHIEAKKEDKKSYTMKDISPWMSDFQPWKYDSYIEIPGQYTGKTKPLPEYHVRVAGFDEKILVLSSATSPRCITIRGNDEKEYKMLVKAGEDLRQDARLQQIFLVMNEIFANDLACSQRHIKLLTYKVIPVSTRLGLIEWVDNSVVLNECLQDAMSREELAAYHSKRFSSTVQEKYWNWAAEGRNIYDGYQNLYATKNYSECVNKFEELVNMVPKYLLRKSFMKLSSSPQAFLTLRAKYAMSHAVICVCHWILGIGDRHLGNFLIDKSSGCEIGIDFGHAFGSATQFIAVPELMPFRLTPQYLQLMEPLREKGIYEATMVHSLSALRSKRDLLLNIMDIFIKEPTLDWKVNARKQQEALGKSSEEADEDINWYPKQRVLIACKKLEGINPCRMTREELKLGHCSSPVFKEMESVCLGDKEHNIRARLDTTGLSVEEQVSCLIDQATDPHILCKSYFGWNPWV